jgi:hypothetical protein
MRRSWSRARVPGRKVRDGRLLINALALDRVPRALDLALANVPTSHGRRTPKASDSGSGELLRPVRELAKNGFQQ